MDTYPLSVRIELLEEGLYLASCPAIRGCHAEGRTIGEALDNLQSVAQVIHDLCREKGLPFITDLVEPYAPYPLIYLFPRSIRSDDDGTA